MKFFTSPKKRLIIACIALVAIISGIAVFTLTGNAETPTNNVSRQATVTRGDIVQGLSETGSASVNTVSTQLDIDLEIDDSRLDLDVIIDDIYVRAGERVTKGQPLFFFD